VAKKWYVCYIKALDLENSNLQLFLKNLVCAPRYDSLCPCTSSPGGLFSKARLNFKVDFEMAIMKITIQLKWEDIFNKFFRILVPRMFGLSAENQLFPGYNINWGKNIFCLSAAGSKNVFFWKSFLKSVQIKFRHQIWTDLAESVRKTYTFVCFSLLRKKLSRF